MCRNLELSCLEMGPFPVTLPPIKKKAVLHRFNGTHREIPRSMALQATSSMQYPLGASENGCFFTALPSPGTQLQLNGIAYC